MGLAKYAYFMQIYVYYYFINPKQWQILSRIFSRITSMVLRVKKNSTTQAQQATTGGHTDLNVTFLSDTYTM